jgi:uncharacterized UPF0160 family protein
MKNILYLFGKKYTVAVHDGKFHADEIFACAVMDIYLKGRMRVIRTRDEDLIEKADYILDVGGEYDHDARMYDHHQKEGAGVRDNGIPYATAGLIWKHYGKKIIKNEELWQIIDKKMVQPIDASDNGVDLVSSNFTDVFPYGISSVINTRRPTWREEGQIDLDKEFLSLVSFFKDLLKRELEIGRDFLIARKEIINAVEVSEYKNFIILNENLPFEDALDDYPEVLFVVSPRADGTWRISGVRKNKHSFERRKDLPSSWGGLRGEALQKMTGEKNVQFCHRGLFLLVANDKETAIRLVKKSLILE